MFQFIINLKIQNHEKVSFHHYGDIIICCIYYLCQYTLLQQQNEPLYNLRKELRAKLRGLLQQNLQGRR
jgi:hypothetical protein